MSIFSSIKNWFKRTFGGGGSSSTSRASRVSNYGGGGSRSYSDYSGGRYKSDYEDRQARERRQRQEQARKRKATTDALASISKRTDSLASGRSPSVASSANFGRGTARVLERIGEKSKATPPDPKEKARQNVQKNATKMLKQISDDRKEFNKATGNKYNVDKNGTRARIAQKSQAYDVKAEKYETEKHPIATSLGRGAVSGLTFGGSEILAKTSKNRQRSGAEAHYQKNKSAKAEMAGEIAGSLVGFGLTEGAATKVASKVAPKALKKGGADVAKSLAKNSAFRTAARKEAERTGIEVTEEVIDRFARQRAQRLVNSIGQDMAVNLTTGGAMDVNQSLRDSMDENGNIDWKKFRKEMGTNAALNLGLGGAVTVAPALRTSKGIIRRGAREDALDLARRMSEEGRMRGIMADVFSGNAERAGKNAKALAEQGVKGTTDALSPINLSSKADKMTEMRQAMQATFARDADEARRIDMNEILAQNSPFRQADAATPEVRPQTVEQAPQMFQPSEALRELDGKGETWLGSYGHITANQDGSYNLFVNGVGDRTLGRAEAEDYISRAVARLNADEEAIRATRTSPLTDAETARISEIDDEIARLRADGLEDANAIKDSKYKGVEKYWERQGERGGRESELTRERDNIVRKEPPTPAEAPRVEPPKMDADIRMQNDAEATALRDSELRPPLTEEEARTLQAVEEAPIRRGYHAGDGGKAEWYGNQAGSRRDTGHYGTGTYFAGSQDILSREGYGNRPLNEIDFSNYNLYRPQDTDQGFRVHDRLKQINRGSDDMDGLAKKFSLNRESSARMLDELDNAETIDDLEAIARRVYSDEELSDIEMSARELLGEWQAQNARVATKPDVLNEDTIDDLIMEDIDFSDINGLESYLRKAESRARETPIEDATIEHAYFNELERTLREDLTKVHENGGEFDEWIDDVANDLGVSREQVENALERTREKVNSYGKNSGFLKEDSASTIFMKELGYEGVDVTGLEGLDNTEFGSVIYDLRPEDMRQIREGKPRRAEPPSVREEAPKAEPPRADEDPSQFAQIDEGMAGIDAEAERQAQRRMPQTEEERLATKIEEKETGRKMTNEEIRVRNENRERLKLKEQEVKPRKMPKGERLTSKVAKKVEGATFEEATKPASAKEIINAEKTYVRGQASNYEKVTSRGGTALMSATGTEAETKVVKDLIDENAFQYARVKNKEKYEWAVREFVDNKEAVTKKMLKYADDIDSIPTSQIVDTHYQAHAVMKMMRSQLDNPALSAEEREAAREIYGAAASLTQQLSSLSGQVNQFQGVMVHCDGKTRMRNAVDNIANILDSSRGFRTSKTGKGLSGNAFQRKNQIRDIIYSDPDASKALEKIIDATTEEQYGDAMQELLYATSKMNRKHALDYVQTWRYLAMLGNPKTHVRNILGNITFGGIRNLSNTNRSIIEKRLGDYAKRHGLEIERHGKASISAFAEARSKNPTTTAGKTAKEWFEKNKDAILSGAKYDENVAKGSDPAMMKWLTWLSDGNGKILEGEDNFFRARSYKESFIKSYSQYAKDGREITDELLEKIHKSALKESQIATFNEFNSMAQVLSKWSHTTFNDSLGRKAAGWTVNAMMPFTKVPSNILKQSVNYSPIGVARGISNITNAAKTGDSEVFNRAIDELSSGLTGTAIAALGFFLGKSTDAFTTNAGSDDAAAKFKKQQGVQNYSVTFTDPKSGEKTSLTLDWLVPTSATFFAGVEMANQLKRGYADLFEFVGDMSQVTSRVIEPVLETSMLSGLYNIVEGARNGTGDDEKQNFFSLTLRELTQSYANSLVPTVQGQLSRTLYKSDKQLTGDTDWEYWINSLKNKMGIANTNALGTEALGADTTAYGDVKNKKEKAGDYAKSALKNFLSPANIQKVDLDEMDEAKIKQYEEAVKNGADPQEMAYLFPKKQYKKEFTTGNLDVTMSNKDLSTYNQAKATGGAEGARYALESIMFNRYTKDERGYKHSTADAYTTEQKQKIIKQFEGKSIRDVEKWVRKQPQFKNADEAEQKKVIDGLWSYSKQGKSQSAKRAGEQAVIKAQGGDVDEYNFNNEITEKKREVLLPYIESGVVSYKDAVEFARLAGKTYYYEDDEGGHSQTYYNKGVMLDYLKSKGYDDETAAALFNSFKAWNAKEYGKSGGRRYGRRRRGYRRWHSHGGGSSKKATVPKPKTLKSSSLAKGKALVTKGSSSSRKATAPTLERVKAKIDLPTPKR